VNKINSCPYCPYLCESLVTVDVHIRCEAAMNCLVTVDVHIGCKAAMNCLVSIPPFVYALNSSVEPTTISQWQTFRLTHLDACYVGGVLGVGRGVTAPQILVTGQRMKLAVSTS